MKYTQNPKCFHRNAGLTRLRFLSVPIALCLLSLACNFPAISAPTITPPDVTKGVPTQTEEPTATRTIPSAALTNTPKPTAAKPHFPAYFPTGLVTNPGSGDKLMIFDLTGSLIAELAAPGLTSVSTPRSRYVHVAGKTSGDKKPPIVYLSTNNDGELDLVVGENVSALVSSPHIAVLLGVPGRSTLAYTNVEWQVDKLVTELYLGNLESLPTAKPVIVRADPESWSLRPLAIALDGDQPAGVWYTLVPWGIGGDIVFEPREGLFYLDIRSGEEKEFFGRDISPSSFSPDLNWLAYTQGREAKPLTITPRSNIESSITFPLAAESNRGAGNAVFSPDNQYVAWMEGSGFLMAAAPEFHILVRIASTGGEIFAEIPAETFAETVETEDIQWAEPVGWLDGKTLVIEVVYEMWERTALVRIKYDGSEKSLLAPGSFAGFIYP